MAAVSAACLDLNGARLAVCSAAQEALPPRPAGRGLGQNPGLIRDPGALAQVESITPDVVEMAGLDGLSPSSGPGTGPGGAAWQVFRCRFETGTADQVALFSAEPAAALADFLSRFWPGIRRLCAAQARDACGGGSSDDALLWMIQRRVNASVLVLDCHCRLINANAAGREMLAQKSLLRDTPQGLSAARTQDSRALRAAAARILEDCAEAGPENCPEYLVFLRRPRHAERVPMTLSLYRPEGGGAPLIMAMLPRPPDQKRIEALAMEMGLTRSEARVAALIRAGHSNREAAKIAGLKVETFNTYAKRVLSKMNVSCRAEMAQMLTWQASMERSL